MLRNGIVRFLSSGASLDEEEKGKRRRMSSCLRTMFRNCGDWVPSEVYFKKIKKPPKSQKTHDWDKNKASYCASDPMKVADRQLGNHEAESERRESETSRRRKTYRNE